MLEALKFVKGAVGKKDYVPALTHFCISNGRITGYNGKISLSAPIALDVDCCPKAVPFVRAVEACNETAQLHLTPTGKLSIRSGKFRAHVDTVGVEVFPEVLPEGQHVQIDGRLLPALRKVVDIIGEDASRQWATGLLLDGNSVFATNNVIIAQHWLGYHFPYRVVVPKYTVKEMIRIGEEPIGMQLTQLNITFHYEGDRWLRSQLICEGWPPVLDILNADAVPEGEVPPVADEFWAALETLAPFLDEATARVFLMEDSVRTAPSEGTSVEQCGTGLSGIYNHKMLSLLHGLADKINFQSYPSRVVWYGDGVRGLLVGMRT